MRQKRLPSQNKHGREVAHTQGDKVRIEQDDLDDLSLIGQTSKDQLRMLAKHMGAVLRRLDALEDVVKTIQELDAERVKEIKEMVDERKNRKWLRKTVAIWFLGIPTFLGVLTAVWQSVIKPFIDWVKAQ